MEGYVTRQEKATEGKVFSISVGVHDTFGLGVSY